MMDIGVNENGYRWVVEDRHTLGKGYAARLWRDGQPTAGAARDGFSTREGAVEWATRYEGGERTIVPIVVVVGFGVLVLLSAVAGLARAIAGVGEVRVVTRYALGRGTTRDLEFGPRARGGARARPRAD